mgnify:CR=1 FL=1
MLRFILNVPPNNKGKVDDAILRRVTEFGTAINKRLRRTLQKMLRFPQQKFAERTQLILRRTYWTEKMIHIGL